MGYKHNLLQLKEVVFDDWHTACLWRNGLETWVTPNEHICILAFDKFLICSEYGELAQNSEIRVFAFDVNSPYAEYVLETWRAPSNEISV